MLPFATLSTAIMRARILIGLHAVLALNAIGGGAYGLAGATGVPVEWLEGTPFATYRVPSLILLVVVGGSQAMAAVLVFRRAPSARATSLLAGAVLLSWIGVQLAMIGYVSWLQPAVAIAGFAMLALGSALPSGRRTD